MSRKKISEPAANRAAVDRDSGRFAYEGLERVLHERARLGILTTLATRPEGVLFPDLKELCALTDGNLCRHLQVLHEAGVVELWKRHDGSRPQTLCRLSRDGRKRFLSYIAVLEEVVNDAERAAKSATESGESSLDPSKGWAPA